MTSKQLGKLYADLKRLRRDHREETQHLWQEIAEITAEVARLAQVQEAR